MIPQAEIRDLIVELRSATAGVGTFKASFDHLAELTGRLADQVDRAGGGREGGLSAAPTARAATARFGNARSAGHLCRNADACCAAGHLGRAHTIVS